MMNFKKFPVLVAAGAAALSVVLAPASVHAQAAAQATAPASAPSTMASPATPPKPAVPSAPTAIDLLEAVQVGQSTVVRVKFNAPLAALPSIFTVANPARLAFDVMGVANRTGTSVKEFNQGELRSIALAQVGDRTRVVFNLKSMVVHTARIDGDSLLVTLSSGAVPQAVSAEPQPRRFAEGDNSVAHQVLNVDFRRGPNGEGRVIVDLSDATTGIDIRQQGQSLLVDFMKATATDAARRRLNVADFGTPLDSILVTETGGKVRMSMEPRGLWEYTAYQADKRFVIEVKPIQYDPNRLTQGSMPGYKGERLSLNFQNVDVRHLLNVIADFTKMNIVASDSVQGQMTIRLQDVPWDQALDLILQTRGLDMRKNNNVIWIAPRDEIAKREKESLESAAAISDLEPVRTESFQLNYSKAADVSKLLGDDKQRILSKRGSVVVDGRTNQLFVQDTASRLEEVRRIVAKVDIPVRQVQIEARIVEADDKFGQTIGVRLGYIASLNGSNPFLGARLNPGGGLGSVGYQTGQITQPQPNFFRDGMNVNLPAGDLGTGYQAGQFAMAIFNSAATRFLNFEIQALEADGKGKIISSPRVVTGDQEKAVIEQGTELPYQQATSSGATSISFRKATLRLEVTPQITPDGNVIMSVDVNKDAPGRQTVSGIAIDTKHVQTKVLVENGGTVVIGGIYQQDERNDVNKVPLLGDLPVMGWLFRTTTKKSDKTELLVFLTPRIIDGRLTAANTAPR